ncbi:MAG: hypothetical protein JXB07_08440 [Anaerolineae bacterium]|nr:hypothetical protein [Anaerolineae bacterium]
MSKHDGEESWGLLAYGRTGRTEVELLEALPPAPESWEIQIGVGSLCLGVKIASADELSRILTFMKTNYGKTKVRKAKADEYPGIPEGTLRFSMVDQIDLSPSEHCSARLSKDGELPDRFVFSLSGPEYHLSFDMHDPQVAELIAALEDVVRDFVE